MQDPIFRLFHQYSKLVRRGQTEALSHTCGETYITRLGDNDELVLYCPVCETTTVPGLGTIDRVKKVVRKYYE